SPSLRRCFMKSKVISTSRCLLYVALVVSSLLLLCLNDSAWAQCQPATGTVCATSTSACVVDRFCDSCTGHPGCVPLTSDPNGTGCLHLVQPDGTTCNDGNACTTGDVCTSGTCGGTPKVCTASDQCHVPGTCDPTTGVCSNPTATNGTPCND